MNLIGETIKFSINIKYDTFNNPQYEKLVTSINDRLKTINFNDGTFLALRDSYIDHVIFYGNSKVGLIRIRGDFIILSPYNFVYTAKTLKELLWKN